MLFLQQIISRRHLVLGGNPGPPTVLAHARTASASAVLALFSAVLVGKNPRTAKGALPPETGSLRRVIDSPYPHRYHSKGSLSILINAMFPMSTGQGASLDTPGAATIESSPHARAMGRSPGRAKCSRPRGHSDLSVGSAVKLLFTTTPLGWVVAPSPAAGSCPVRGRGERT